VRRFGIFSLTGYGIPNEGEYAAGTPRRWGTNAPRHAPATTWYVTDDAYCGEVVFQTPYEHVARKKAIDLNALDRKYDKEVEREREFASNGRA
jgi:hypothetical protein